jgi:hypothetical protein
MKTSSYTSIAVALVGSSILMTPVVQAEADVSGRHPPIVARGDAQQPAPSEVPRPPIGIIQPSKAASHMRKETMEVQFGGGIDPRLGCAARCNAQFFGCIIGFQQQIFNCQIQYQMCFQSCTQF